MYRVGLYSAGAANREFGEFSGGAVTLGVLGYDFGPALGVREALLTGNYVYQHPDADNTFTRQLEHVLSLHFKLEADKWGLRADVSDANGYLGQSDMWGAMAMPFYNITDKLQAVTRYTYIDSENPGDTYFDIDGEEHDDAPVQGLSKNNYNVTAMYERGPVSVRLAWSWRSKYLQSTNSNGTNGNYDYFSAPGVSAMKDIALPIYGDEYGQLDFGTTWRPNEKLALSLELQNVTNEITRTLMGGYPGGTTIRSWFVSDRRVNLSTRYNF